MIARRAVVTGLCACVGLAACGKERGGAWRAEAYDTDNPGARDSGPPVDEEPVCAEDTGAPVDDWVEVPLLDFPELATPGGFAYVEIPERLVNVVVACLAEGCWVALWRICTHGACATEWDPATREATCPCHGSVFGADGAVQIGPATVGLRSFPVVRRGDSLFLHR